MKINTAVVATAGIQYRVRRKCVTLLPTPAFHLNWATTSHSQFHFIHCHRQEKQSGNPKQILAYRSPIYLTQWETGVDIGIHLSRLHHSQEEE
ncbi:hypothetical protein TNCT_532371 [Trichonephila clavata]|uniref:Uncharacterized protein n=1 Tax=Trichonephila clavata TaxID=2740835 RepID=A0A8X6KHX9_TRICU|nr:hypothetical protein TNCT_532371 [Trichonephila clavata]